MIEAVSRPSLAMQSGVSDVHFHNPFTNQLEPFRSEEDANKRMLIAAADRISELQEEIRCIKAHLVLS